jgi:hypothetical protein
MSIEESSRASDEINSAAREEGRQGATESETKMSAVEAPPAGDATPRIIDPRAEYYRWLERKPRGGVDGWSFVHDLPADIPALWGDGQHVLWAEGEGTLIVGPEGVGKTTLAQQLVLGLCGYRRELLDLPVKQASKPVLYLALDRPRQIARSMGRMVKDGRNYGDLAERLMVWQGPLPFDLTADPRALVEWATTEFWNEPGVIVVDSYKDLAPDLSAEATGWAINQAMQECLAEGVEWVGLHHQRKAQRENKKPNALADVYGSRWLTAGTGSVIALWGEAGDALVEVKHLKQPAERVGPLAIAHDHTTGTTEVLDMDISAASVPPRERDRRAAILALFGDDRDLTFKDIHAATAGVSDKTLRKSLEAMTATRLLVEESSPGLPSVWRRP